MRKIKTFTFDAIKWATQALCFNHDFCPIFSPNHGYGAICHDCHKIVGITKSEFLKEAVATGAVTIVSQTPTSIN